LLKIGRHFRIGRSKLILGRDESESKFLEKMRNHLVLKPKSKGPSGIFIGEESDLMLACEILASYCKDEKVVIELLKNGEKIKEVEVQRKNKEEFIKYMIV
jgi:hypothetical protein